MAGGRRTQEELAITGQAGDWGDPIALTRFGLSGFIDYVGARSEVGSGVAGTIDVKVFVRRRDRGNQEILDWNPLKGDYVTNGLVDPDAALLGETVLLWSSVTVAEGSDTPSDTLNTGASIYAQFADSDVWVAVKGVAGEVKLTFAGTVGPGGGYR